MLKCPVCAYQKVTGEVCPNCKTNLAPFLRTLELPRLYLQRGIDSLSQGRVEEAIQVLSAALSADPGSVDTCVALGRAYGERGSFREAIASFYKALSLDPQLEEARQSRASARQSLERQEAERLQRARQAARLRTLVRALPAAAFLLGLAVWPVARWIHSPAPLPPPSVLRQDAAPRPAAAPPPEVSPVRYTVRAGDSLWRIARRKYGTALAWPQIQARNPLGSPPRLSPGRELWLYPVTLAPR